MNKTFKKVLSVVLTLAMVLTSITVYNATTKADGVVTVEITATADDKNGIDANWTNPEGTRALLSYIFTEEEATKINSAEDIPVCGDDSAQNGTNSWCWNKSTKPCTEPRVNNVVKNYGGTIDTKKGGNFVIVVVYYDSYDKDNDTWGNVIGFGKSNVVTVEKNSNTSLNLKVERYDFTNNNKLAFLKWSLIAGATKYQIWNADTNQMLKETGNDWEQVDIEAGKNYNFEVKAIDETGNIIETTNNTISVYYANADMNLKVSYSENVAKLLWQKITDVSKYKIYDNDNEIAELGADATNYSIENLVKDEKHSIIIKAYKEDGSEIEITNNTIEVVYTVTEPGMAPDEHIKADFSNATWAELSTKAGTADNRYFINADHTLSQAVWYGIYAPHSAAAYHNDRTACILGDAASFTFQQSNVTSVWINGKEYANPSTALNCQGDCTEISTEFLNAGINVVTIVMSDGKTNTFGIKVDAPLGVDATAPAAQDTIDPATVAEWTQMAGTTANGSKVFKDATVTTSTNGGLDGCYAANSSPKWNITDIMNAKAVFGVVRGGTNSVIIDGVEYINANDKRSEKVYIGNDCIYVDAALLDAPTGKTQYHMITLTGGTALTFILKVEGPEAPTAKVTVDGKEVPVENGKVTLGDAKYGYFCAGKMYKPGTEVTVNEDMEFTSVNTLSVTMADGAGIRYIGESGLRFQSTIASDNMEAVASDAITEGTLITTKVIFDNNNDTLELGYSHAMINVKNSGWFGDKVGTYCGSVCKITDNKREFIAKSYVTVNYEDGTSKTVYSGMGPSRSVQFVAQAIIDAKYPGIDEKYHSVIDDYAK